MIGAAWAADSVPTGHSFHDNARGPAGIMEMTKPPVLGNAINDDVRRTRNYTWQPPTIPHRVDGYQVDKNFNKCMDCHSRAKAEVSQAVPVSITHYMTREGQTLGQVSTRRYFCMQCHVSQENARPIVENKFMDVDSLILKRASTGNAAKR
nr:nitrate reductase cytochrome c-type subunit [Diaphorobacter aerolatus]